MGQRVRLAIENGIARITLDDGKVNAMSSALLGEIDEALGAAERAGALVVLRGREGIFSAGFDLPTFQRGPAASVAMVRAGAELIVWPETAVPGGLAREATTAAGPGELSIATFNVENLDPGDPPAKFAELAGLIVNNLAAPDLLSLEEVQDDNGPTNNGIVSATQTLNQLVAVDVAREVLEVLKRARYLRTGRRGGRRGQQQGDEDGRVRSWHVRTVKGWLLHVTAFGAGRGWAGYHADFR